MKTVQLALLLSLLALAPARAERLVPRGGDPIQTDGGWERRGDAVIFTGTDGRLYLLPSAEVDWARTEALNQHPAVRAVSGFIGAHDLEIADVTTLRWVVAALVHGDRVRSAAPARRAPVLVLTDNDVAHVRPRVVLPEDRFPVAWKRSFEPSGDLTIVGTLRNRSDLTLSGVELEIRLLDDDDEVRESQRLALRQLTVPPGESATFRYRPRQPDFSGVAVSARGRLGQGGG